MQAVNYGDDKALRWRINRDPSTLVSIKVRFAVNPGDPAVLEKDAVPDGEPSDWIIMVVLEAADYGEGQLEVGEYVVKARTTDAEGNVLTHPDDIDAPHERLEVLATLGPEEG